MIYPCVLNQMSFTKEVRLFNLLSKENCRAVFGAWQQHQIENIFSELAKVAIP